MLIGLPCIYILKYEIYRRKEIVEIAKRCTIKLKI